MKLSARFRTLLIVLIIADITAAFEASMVLAALKTVITETGDVVAASWLVTAYLLTAAITAPLGGRLGDMFGRSRVLIALLAAAAAGTFLSALAQDFNMVLLGRALQGTAGAILPLCHGIVRERLPEDQLPKAIGLLGAASGFGVAAGLLIGGFIVDHWHWQFIFYVSGGMAILTIVIVVFFLTPSQAGEAPQNLDILGGILFAAGTVLLLYAISRMTSFGWQEPYSLMLAGAGLTTLALCVLYELRIPSPLLDFRALSVREIALANLATALVAVGTVQLVQILLLLLQQPPESGIGFGLSATYASTLKLPSSVSAIVASVWAGRFAARRGSSAALILGASVVTIAWITLFFFHDWLPLVIAITMFITAGFSTMLIAISTMIVKAAPGSRTSEASGFNMVIRSMFMGIGALLVGVVLSQRPIDLNGLIMPGRTAYLALFLIIAAFSAVALLCGMAIKRRPTDGGRLDGSDTSDRLQAEKTAG